MAEEIDRESDKAGQALEGGSEFHPLDPRVIPLWRLTNSFGYAAALLVLLASAVTLALRYPEFGVLIIIVWLALLIVSGWLVYWRPPRLYRSWGYRIDERVLETRSGLMFQVTELLPLTRLQHVDLHRGPLERAFGLSTLILHTAGTQNSTIAIPGLDAGRAVALRDHLVEVGGDDAV